MIPKAIPMTLLSAITMLPATKLFEAAPYRLSGSILEDQDRTSASRQIQRRCGGKDTEVSRPPNPSPATSASSVRRRRLFRLILQTNDNNAVGIRVRRASLVRSLNPPHAGN